jgi:outer membrane protein OmpA-like peptidoglycan-associated protein
MLSTPQRDQGYTSGFVPDLHPALRVSSAFAAELAVASWFFPRAGGGNGRATFFGAGLRWDPRLVSWLTWFVDGHAGVGLTGADNRFMLDAGTGFEVWLRPNLALGPFFRYGQVMDSGPDPRFWSAGLAAAFTFGSASDEPPSLGPADPDREERQREWERNRQVERQSPRFRDRDGDGLVDERDICPDQKMGRNPDPNMPGCPREEKERSAERAPAGDRDGDGVPDRDDKCPSRPFGNNPDPLAMGCPLPDRDHDTVPDLQDACPSKPGMPDNLASANGCPGLVNIDHGVIHLQRPILFAGNGDRVAAASIPVLNAVADVLKAAPVLRKVSIEGHADGPQSQDLSERRAESVRRWLVSNGVEPDRLVARGYGDSRPLASGRTAKGRAANARVELIVIEP